ncbi:MmpS family transport accessory protein [Streptomyces sp. NPDC049555]|uniref:MmpS family transport accessory protein n=1 Tax=Streptomyces sp. NPDC049555 TaxID=3154930 RepID=UPI003439C28B
MRKKFAGVVIPCVLLVGCSAERAYKDETERLDNKEFEVVYEVTGSNVKDLTYGVGDRKKESSETVENPTLPWSKTVTMKGIATAPSLSLILGESGGKAECVIKVNGKEARRATATGEFGTATCVAVSPAGHGS